MMSRRDVLRSAAAAPAVAALPSSATESRIPAPFDVLETIDDPDDAERRMSKIHFPPRAVPETGPIPDHYATHVVERDLVVPEWVLESATWRLSKSDPERWDTRRAEEFLMEYAQIHERFLTPDGQDAAEVILDAVSE